MPAWELGIIVFLVKGGQRYFIEPPQGCQQSHVGGVCVGCLEKEYIEHDQGAVLIGQTIEEFRVDGAIPWLGGPLLTLHKDEHHLIGHVTFAEPEQIIEARSAPGFAKAPAFGKLWPPQEKAAKHRQRRSHP